MTGGVGDLAGRSGPGARAGRTLAGSRVTQITRNSLSGVFTGLNRWAEKTRTQYGNITLKESEEMNAKSTTSKIALTMLCAGALASAWPPLRWPTG